MMFDPDSPDPRRSKKRTEALAFKFLIIGMFVLPFVWLHSILYFRKSIMHPDITKRAKLCKFYFVVVFS